jgi:hypothetical protein
MKYPFGEMASAKWVSVKWTSVKSPDTLLFISSLEFREMANREIDFGKIDNPFFRFFNNFFLDFLDRQI